ncbi:hypothetical protein [Streptomyces lacrimifluminis]|nr:hypothetical protein [Streptomyces lacrimifluminis]
MSTAAPGTGSRDDPMRLQVVRELSATRDELPCLNGLRRDD